MSQMRWVRTMCVAAGAALVAYASPPQEEPDRVSPTYRWSQACPDVRAHAATAWEVTPQQVDGTFRDMFLRQERTGCRFSAAVAPGQAQVRFNALKSAMVNDGWFEDDVAASDTTAGLDRGQAVCYATFRPDPAHVEIECFPRPGVVWQDD